ncbi:hypothetical protein T4D_11031 [Trichinella pseudospiralis]|uniref:Uncharacterized protein n=1 Tax=Trichinella pseudospiralis TaxID=6337 RepID=A0A0V1G6C5_TRIPS|nr:hypothetical protein T4D_11031 [Trichinella pseudospiralis]
MQQFLKYLLSLLVYTKRRFIPVINFRLNSATPRSAYSLTFSFQTILRALSCAQCSQLTETNFQKQFTRSLQH